MNKNKTLGVFLIGILIFSGFKTLAQHYSPLPSGFGLSENHFYDKNIQNNVKVIFYDGFEKSTWMEDWDQTWANAGEHKVIVDKQQANSGSNSYKATIFRPNSIPSSIGIRKYFDEGYPVLFMRYYAKYDIKADLYHGGTHNGAGLSARRPGEMHQSYAGFYPDGENLYTVVLDTWRPDSAVKTPGQVAFYCYHLNQGHQWGDHFFPSGRIMPGGRNLFGETFVQREDFTPELGKWYCYELMVRTNTVGKKDGRIAFWIDGKLVGDFDNIEFRTTDKLATNRAELMLYTHNTNIKSNVSMWFDDVVVATSYIGPIKTE